MCVYVCMCACVCVCVCIYICMYVYVYVYVKLEAFRQWMHIFPIVAHWVVGSSHQENGVLSLSDIDQSVLFSCGWLKVTAGRPLNVRNVRIIGIVNWERFRIKRHVVVDYVDFTPEELRNCKWTPETGLCFTGRDPNPYLQNTKRCSF